MDQVKGIMFLLSTLLVVLCLSVECRHQQDEDPDFSGIPDEKWGYVTVRPKAHMFWWVYGALNKATRSQQPLILWLQGGPGGSGTGFGNFFEIGPVDMNNRPRNTTWLSQASLLIIDNPVGTGFSYVEDTQAFTTNVTQIADDLFVIFSAILQKIPAFRYTPFYIFCESYGGKMTAAFAERLYQGIRRREITCNFKGVGLGDSWIAPVDSTLSWGPLLYQMSLLDEMDLNSVNGEAKRAADAFARGDYYSSWRYWARTEGTIDRLTDRVNLYNILQHNAGSPFYDANMPSTFPNEDNDLANLYARHVAIYQKPSLYTFMNTNVRRKLGIIPRNVVWGGQGGQVFQKQANDFMKPVIKTVSKLINYGLRVVVFQGQLDLICSTPAAETWIRKLDWPKLQHYLSTPRKALYVRGKGKQTQAFLKSYENFSLYYIMNAGHMVPYDNGDMALEMVKQVLHG